VPAIILALGFLVICSIVARYRKYPSREAVDWKTKRVPPAAHRGRDDAGDHHRRYPLRVLTVTESAALAVLYAAVRLLLHLSRHHAAAIAQS
jgi:hypothetical protein